MQGIDAKQGAERIISTDFVAEREVPARVTEPAAKPKSAAKPKPKPAAKPKPKPAATKTKASC